MCIFKFSLEYDASGFGPSGLAISVDPHNAVDGSAPMGSTVAEGPSDTPCKLARVAAKPAE